MSLTTAWQALQDAVSGVGAGTRVYTDPGANIIPPAVVIGLPDLTWETYSSSEPTEMTSTLYLMVKSDETSEKRLVALLELVAAALYESTDFVITKAQPALFLVGTTDLPAYALDVVGPAN